MVKVYDFVIAECVRRWKKQYPELWKEYHPNAVPTKEMEDIINKECKDIVSINTNTYISEHFDILPKLKHRGFLPSTPMLRLFEALHDSCSRRCPTYKKTLSWFTKRLTKFLKTLKVLRLQRTKTPKEFFVQTTNYFYFSKNIS